MAGPHLVRFQSPGIHLGVRIIVAILLVSWIVVAQTGASCEVLHGWLVVKLARPIGWLALSQLVG